MAQDTRLPKYESKLCDRCTTLVIYKWGHFSGQQVCTPGMRSAAILMYVNLRHGVPINNVVQCRQVLNPGSLLLPLLQIHTFSWTLKLVTYIMPC